MLKQHFLPAAILCSFLAWGGAAHAQAPAEDPEAQLQKATDLADKGRMAEAIKIWEAIADKLPPDKKPAVHQRLGMAYRKFAKLPEAWYHLTRYLSLSGTPDKEASEQLRQLETALPRQHRKVAFSCDPEGSVVRLAPGDDAAGYPCPFSFWLKAGRLQIRAEKPGFQPSSSWINVEAGEGEVISAVKLQPLEQFGMLEVKGSEIGAQVFLDGLLEGSIPFKRKMKAGSYELMVGRPGRPVWKKQIEIPAGGEVVERPLLAAFDDEEEDLGEGPGKSPDGTGTVTGGGVTKPGGLGQAGDRPKAPKAGDGRKGKARSGQWKGGLGLLVSGLAVAAGGGAMQVAGYLKNERAHEDYPPVAGKPTASQANLDKYQEEHATAKRMQAAGIALCATGGAAALVGIVLLAVEGKKDRVKVMRMARISPLLGKDGAGLMVGIGF
jgi:hypothetical protein